MNQADVESTAVILDTLLVHTSGEWIKGTVKLTPVKNDPQGFSSAMTYARRICLSAVLGIATEDDDDGNAASEPKKKPAPRESAYSQKGPTQFWLFDKDQVRKVGVIPGDKLTPDICGQLGMKEWKGSYYADYEEELVKQLVEFGGSERG